ncbi:MULTISPECIES: hypothetical protein [Bradyrhizobium]|uniref:hypothetical protein n=1 Tax=Bradyrhizobium TaxID=374 RepID=UPI0023060E11|nr:MULTISPECIES: hypothetical protein [Bradyrhizobium]WLB34847.1 hypothetical protein QIH78_25535 [Bradyrhizobium diazoefficiens]
MKQADIVTGGFYLGGKSQRIREVIAATDWSVMWRDADPETLNYFWLAQEKGDCERKSFASWAKRKVEPEELQARLALPKEERYRLSTDWDWRRS